MRMLVLGAGLQGSACAYDLLQDDAVERVVLADLDVASLPGFLEPFQGDDRLETVALDARDRDAVLAVMRDVDACMNALPYYFAFDVAKLAVESSTHCCDLGGNTEIVFRQLELDDAAADAGITVIPDCGLAPGMVNILAAACIAELDETASVRIRVGGLPREPEPPLNYQIVYSLEGVLDYYTTPSWVLRDGAPAQVEALSEVEPVAFADPVGTLEAFHTAGGLSVMPWTYEGRIDSMEYKTLRYPGHADTVRAIRELGLLDLEPVKVGEDDIIPRELFIACAEPRLRKPQGHDLVALRVEAEGERGGNTKRIVYELVDFYDESTGISAMERTTSFSLAITGRMQMNGRVGRPGVRTPDQCIPADAYIRELNRRGMRIHKREE